MNSLRKNLRPLQSAAVTQLWLGCSQTPPSPPRNCRPPRNTPSPDFQERKAQSQTGSAAADGSGMNLRHLHPQTLKKSIQNRRTSQLTDVRHPIMLYPDQQADRCCIISVARTTTAPLHFYTDRGIFIILDLKLKHYVSKL